MSRLRMPPGADLVLVNPITSVPTRKVYLCHGKVYHLAQIRETLDDRRPTHVVLTGCHHHRGRRDGAGNRSRTHHPTTAPAWPQAILFRYVDRSTRATVPLLQRSSPEAPLTEVPEHLLQRSQAARARLTGEGGEAPAAAAVGDEAGAATTPAVAADTPAPVEIEPVEVPAAPVPPYVQAAIDRPKIPYWVVPVLLVLPIWGFFYAGSLERPADTGGLTAEGTEVYGGQGCSGCHGAGGGGGTGRQLSNGEVLATFPDPLGQVWWVVNGSPAAGTPYGDPSREGGQHTALSWTGVAMAGYRDALSAEEIVAVVHHERILSGADPQDLVWMEEWVDSADFPEDFAELSADELTAIAELRETASEFLPDGVSTAAAAG